MRIKEERLETLKSNFNKSNASIIITNPSGVIEYVNPQFEKRTGYSKSEVIGKNPKILKSNHTKPQKYKDLWKTITSGKNWSGEFENRKKNGELFWEYSTIYPIINDKQEVLHFLAIKEDITSLKKMDNDIKKEKIKSKIYAVLKYNFLNRISHEIRTPANIMISFANIFRNHYQSSDISDLSPYLTVLEDLNKELIATIDFILNISEFKPDPHHPKLKFLKPDFTNDLVNAIKIPTQIILANSVALQSKCSSKLDEELKLLFDIMFASCHRVISTINIIAKNSKSAKDEEAFVRDVSKQIDTVKESYLGDADKKIFNHPPSNLPDSFVNKLSSEEQSYPRIVNTRIKEDEWLDDLLENSGDIKLDKQIETSTPSINRYEKDEKENQLYQLNKNQLIELKQENDIAIVFVKYKHVDFMVTRSVEKLMENKIIGSTTKIILDFTLSNSIESCFWGLLIKFIKQHKLEPSHVALILNISLQPNTFILSKLDLIFPVFNNLNDGLNNLNKIRNPKSSDV